MEDLIKNNKGIQILTDTGFSDFDALIDNGVKDTVMVYLENDLYIQCTNDHEVYTENLNKIEANKLTPGTKVCTSDGVVSVLKVDNAEPARVYDIQNVEKHNRFFANGLLVSNCKFISFEETLINPMKLEALKGREPIRKTAQVRWYKDIDPECTYVLTLDPSMGTGGDNSAIQVFEMPTFRQVAEWQHNKSPVEDQMRVLRQIAKEIEEHDYPEIYWTVESNSLGEACLSIIREIGEENFPGNMLHDPNRDSGVRGKRKGFLTTKKTKLEGCAKLKHLIEHNKLEVASKALATELRHFVAKGKSYEARSGLTDDLVMATVVFVRMAMFISSWDDESYENMTSLDNDTIFGEEGDEFDEPMPTIV